MANVLDYLDWRGDLLFAQDPVNEIDMLIFSILSYTNMDGLTEGEDITIEELYRRYEAAGYDQSRYQYDPKPLLEKASHAVRTKDIIVSRYVNHLDPEQNIQFSAMTFLMGDHTCCIAYRGTDPTLTGWHVDFYFSCMEQTPAQLEATEYLNDCDAEKIFITGHSKGGNLAIYAGTYCHAELQDKIQKIVSFDGPGFQSEMLYKDIYHKQLWKMRRFAPENSVIGQLMHNDARQTVMKSNEKSLLQHDPYSWQILGKSFEETELSRYSLFVKEAIDTWLEGISLKDRKRFIDTIFQVAEASGYHSIKDIDEHRFETFKAVVKALSDTDRKQIKQVSEILSKFASDSSDVFWNEIRKNLPWEV